MLCLYNFLYSYQRMCKFTSSRTKTINQPYFRYKLTFFFVNAGAIIKIWQMYCKRMATLYTRPFPTSKHVPVFRVFQRNQKVRCSCKINVYNFIMCPRQPKQNYSLCCKTCIYISTGGCLRYNVVIPRCSEFYREL